MGAVDPVLPPFAHFMDQYTQSLKPIFWYRSLCMLRALLRMRAGRGDERIRRVPDVCAWELYRHEGAS